MDSVLKIISLLIFFLGKNNIVFGYSANVTKPVVWTNVEETVVLFCASGNTHSHSLEFCRWTRSSLDVNSTRTISVNESRNSITESSGSGNYSYFGSGMENGECGLKISNVSLEQIGNWGCTLIGKEIWIGIVSLLLYEKPSPPKIWYNNLSNIADLGEGKNLSIVCCASEGKPIDETKLTFHYGDAKIEEYIFKDNDDESCIKWDTTLTFEDNGKTLECTLQHPAFTDSKILVNNLTINVNYAPKVNENNVNVTVIDKYVDFNFIAEGNPKPNISISGKPEEGSAIAQPVKVVSTNFTEFKAGRYYVKLRIDLPNENGSYSYIITSSNDYGSTNVSLPLIVSPQPDQQESSFMIMLIIGIVMSVIFLAIIIYILNLVAKRKGYLCYEKRTGTYPVRPNSSAERTVEYSNVSGADDIRL